MVDFLEKEVKVLSHPLFGDISEPRPNNSPLQAATRSSPLQRSKSSFATTTTVTSEPTAHNITNQSVASRELDSESCLYCGESHPLCMCLKLNSVSQREKIEFLKSKGICFGCLKAAGHMSIECRSRLTCDECHLKHPTILHVHNQDKVLETASITSALVSLQAYGCNGAGDQNCTLSVVPVQVKSNKGDKVLQTYAFLDPGSTATFCTNRLKTKLKLQGKKTNMLLRTIGQERIVKGSVLTGLQVSKLGCNQFMELPETFTH